MEFFLRVFFVSVLILTTPIPTQVQGQCALPTSEEVTDSLESLLQSQSSASTSKQSVNIMQIHFTCLATVALEKYSYASVVVNFTVTSSNAPDANLVRQFQLKCGSSSWARHPSNGFDLNVPSMPFDIETEYQCSECVQRDPSPVNYDSVSNCLHCAPHCLDNGGGYCTNAGGDSCCPSFDGDSGACVDNCTTINPNFARNESNSVCVCNVACDAGCTLNTSNCSCVCLLMCDSSGVHNCSHLPVATAQIQPATEPTAQPQPSTATTSQPQPQTEQVAQSQPATELTAQPWPTTKPTAQTWPTTAETTVHLHPTTESTAVNEKEARTLFVPVVTGTVIGVLLFVLVILGLAAMCAYVVHARTKKHSGAKEMTVSFHKGESHSNSVTTEERAAVRLTLD